MPKRQPRTSQVAPRSPLRATQPATPSPHPQSQYPTHKLGAAPHRTLVALGLGVALLAGGGVRAAWRHCQRHGRYQHRPGRDLPPPPPRLLQRHGELWGEGGGAGGAERAVGRQRAPWRMANIRVRRGRVPNASPRAATPPSRSLDDARPPNRVWGGARATSSACRAPPRHAPWRRAIRAPTAHLKLFHDASSTLKGHARVVQAVVRGCPRPLFPPAVG